MNKHKLYLYIHNLYTTIDTTYVYSLYIALMMLRCSDEIKFNINLNCLTCMHLKLFAGH